MVSVCAWLETDTTTNTSNEIKCFENLEYTGAGMIPFRLLNSEVGNLFSPGQKKTGTGMFNTGALAGYQNSFANLRAEN
jgi:hypothetical protein